jgi:thiol-disulfide isomerase/thioredoxin
MATVHMPPLGGATGWINSEPLSPDQLRGNVVLVNFWTLTCINWLRTEPFVRAWSRAYRDDGLVVLGVHTPEFSFEHEIDHVQRAVREREIDYPVMLDNDYEIWRAFDNHAWPALFFVDRDGIIRDFHYGEGQYEQSERLLQSLLGIDRDLVRVEGTGVEAEADWDHLRTPETYLGYERGAGVARPGGGMLDESHTYEFPPYLGLNQWGLDGVWTVEREKAIADQAAASIAFRFEARDAHLVLSSPVRRPIPFRIALDGKEPGRSHGADVDEQGYGRLNDARLYQLVREHGEIGERVLEITFLESGAEAYAFTFG